MHSGRAKVVIHPILFFFFPLVSLFAHNAGQVHLRETLRATVIGLCTTAAIFFLLFLLSRSWHKVGLAVSFLIGLFFSFGHVYTLIHQAVPNAGVLGQANVMAAVWSAVLILGVWAALRVLPPLPGLTRVLNLMSAALLLLSSLNLAGYGLQLATHRSARSEASAAPAAPHRASALASGSGPDVYYIILDGYGRDDLLAEAYGLPENDFTAFLRERGFYIASDSHANYGQTSLSLSSSLNFNYLDRLVSVDPGTLNPALAEGLIQDSAAARFFQSRGYRSVAFATGYAFTELRKADVYYGGNGWLNHYEEMLLKNTMAVLWLDAAAPEAHRRGIRAIFANLVEAADLPGPKFVFAHIVVPHPPFVFDRNGRPVQPLGAGDGQYYYGTQESYLEGYREQLLFTNRLAQEAIDQILARSKTPPVVIVQGDHGPGAYVDFESLGGTCIRERFSILNAYYLPSGMDGQEASLALYPSISPVNTFRVVLNMFFGQSFPLLEDYAYYSTWSRPFDFTEVDDRLDDLCLSKPE